MRRHPGLAQSIPDAAEFVPSLLPPLVREGNQNAAGDLGSRVGGHGGEHVKE
jgi:hypothetical protein